MFKKKIVIRSFTCRRDAANAILLAKCLERMGCDVIIASIRNFKFVCKYWKPHIAVFNVTSGGIFVKNIDPNILTVYLDGEGHMPNEEAYREKFSKKPDIMSSIDIVLVWGEIVKKYMKLAFPSKKNIHVVGWQSLDFIRYNNWRSNKKTIGFVMRSPAINDHQGSPTIRTICNPGNLNRIIIQAKSFVTTINCMKEVLKNSDFDISIRPHPLEQIESYKQYKSKWFKGLEHRVNIDETLSFSEWVSDQKLIVSPTSLSSLEAYLSNVPIINIDKMIGIDKYSKNYSKLTLEWHQLANIPKNKKEFIDMINNKYLSVKKNKTIDKQLKEYCNAHVRKSASMEAAQRINNHKINMISSRVLCVPKFLIRFHDELSFKKQCKLNPLHPNFNYKEGYHKPIKQFNELIERIIN